MESILQLCESRNFKYPDYFETFLNNCLEKFHGNFSANDYLFAAVYFIVLECGFCPIESNDGSCFSTSDSFDIRTLRLIKCYSSEHMKPVKNNLSEYWVYGIQLKLGNYRSISELQGIPSAENNCYLIINFLSKELGIIRSSCLNTENYTENNQNSSIHTVRLKNLQELSLKVKDKVSNIIKESIMLNEGKGCYPHLLRLPEETQKKIIYFLKEDSTNVQYLAATCSYFYSIITNDFKLWEIICLAEFDGKQFNKALQEVVQINQEQSDHKFKRENVYRKIFLELKKRKVRGVAGSYIKIFDKLITCLF